MAHGCGQFESERAMLQNQLHILQEETVAARQQWAAHLHSCVLAPQDDQHQEDLKSVLAMQQVCVCVCVWLPCVCVCVVSSAAAGIHCRGALSIFWQGWIRTCSV